MQGLKDWTMNCLKEPVTGYRRQVRRVNDWMAGCLRLKRGEKKTTLRVIELDSAITFPERSNVSAYGYGYSRTRFHLGSVKFEEHKV